MVRAIGAVAMSEPCRFPEWLNASGEMVDLAGRLDRQVTLERAVLSVAGDIHGRAGP